MAGSGCFLNSIGHNSVISNTKEFLLSEDVLSKVPKNGRVLMVDLGRLGLLVPEKFTFIDQLLTAEVTCQVDQLLTAEVTCQVDNLWFFTVNAPPAHHQKANLCNLHFRVPFLQ